MPWWVSGWVINRRRVLTRKRRRGCSREGRELAFLGADVEKGDATLRLGLDGMVGVCVAIAALSVPWHPADKQCDPCSPINPCGDCCVSSGIDWAVFFLATSFSCVASP